MTTQTETTTLAGSLPALAELMRLAALYASTEKPLLAAAQITGNIENVTLEATDSYAAIRYSTNYVSMTGPTVYLPAAEIHKATTAAVRTHGKRHAQHIDATLTTDGQHWTLTAGTFQISGPTTQPATWPNMAPLFEPTQPSDQPYTMTNEQLARLAATGNKITHTVSSPTKPNHYQTKTQHGHAHIIIMPTRTP